MGGISENWGTVLTGTGVAVGDGKETCFLVSFKESKVAVIIITSEADIAIIRIFPTEIIITYCFHFFPAFLISASLMPKWCAISWMTVFLIFTIASL